MRRIAILAAALALCAAIYPSTYADVEDWYIGLHYGVRGYTSDEVENLDADRGEALGIEGLIVPGESGFGYQIGYWRGWSDGSPAGLDVDLTLQEVSFGIGYQTHGRAPWYFGVGASYCDAEADIDVVSDDPDDTDFGAYVSTSIRWKVPERASFGLAARALVGANLNDAGLDYFQLSAFMAFGGK